MKVTFLIQNDYGRYKTFTKDFKDQIRFGSYIVYMAKKGEKVIEIKIDSNLLPTN